MGAALPQITLHSTFDREIESLWTEYLNHESWFMIVVFTSVVVQSIIAYRKVFYFIFVIVVVVIEN